MASTAVRIETVFVLRQGNEDRIILMASFIKNQSTGSQDTHTKKQANTYVYVYMYVCIYIYIFVDSIPLCY
jgi:hypothetical protein